MLKLENVSKFYYNKGSIATGFTKVNLELKIGEFVVITGESGSGKSTLLNVLSGLDSYEEGEMYVNGEETSHYTAKDFEDYRRKYIANIFQSFNLVNSYTVYQNIELVLLLNGYKRKDVKAKVLDMIEQVGLTEFQNTKVSKLSGGQKQRVAIARAMVKETPIIVADEPTGNLDSESAKEVIQILKKVAKDKLVVVVTHNIEQVEEFATRVIKMHDGRIRENTQIKEIAIEPKVEESKYQNMTLNNKYRLGFRNTFNIVTKFCLLFAVFFFMSSAVLAEYASFQMSEDEKTPDLGSFVFHNLAENRVIINKKDRTPFTEEEFAKLKQMENIQYVAEDDVLVDRNLQIKRGDMSIYGYLGMIENFHGELAYGRMPENENEVICKMPEDDFKITHQLDQLLNQVFELQSYDKDQAVANVKIVGIETYQQKYATRTTIYLPDNILREIRKTSNKSYSKVKEFMNNKYYEYDIVPSEKVEKGTVLADDDWRYNFKDGKIKNQTCMVMVDNIYYHEELELKIAGTYTKNNFKKTTGQDNYDRGRSKLYLNPEDYNSLYDKPSYQASVYVADLKKIDNTMAEIGQMGIQPKKVTDFTEEYVDASLIITRIMKVIVTIILLIVLFFISYLIISIILKSRHVYYTTLRMLGATYKNVRRVLDIELFANASIAYCVLLVFLGLCHYSILPITMITKLTNFLHLPEYIGMYVILILIARLISIKFSKKLFKKTAITTYNEEV